MGRHVTKTTRTMAWDGPAGHIVATLAVVRGADGASIIRDNDWALTIGAKGLDHLTLRADGLVDRVGQLCVRLQSARVALMADLQAEAVLEAERAQPWLDLLEGQRQVAGYEAEAARIDATMTLNGHTY